MIARIKNLMAQFRLTSNAFAIEAGIDPSNFSKMLDGKQKISKKTINKISQRFNVSHEWLLNGEGEMFMPQQYRVDEVEELNHDEQDNIVKMVDRGEVKMVPLIHIDSVGGIHSDNLILSPEYIERYIPMTGARTGDVAIYQSGNSMAPAIPSGALLLIREVEGWREYIGYGDVFVMLLNDERRITKEIRRYAPDPQNFYWCVSYNPDVADEELPKSIVRRVWKVIKVLIDKGW